MGEYSQKFKKGRFTIEKISVTNNSDRSLTNLNEKEFYSNRTQEVEDLIDLNNDVISHKKIMEVAAEREFERISKSLKEDQNFKSKETHAEKYIKEKQNKKDNSLKMSNFH